MKALALVRIATVLLIWSEWMGPLRPSHHAARPEILALTVLPWLTTPFLLVGWFSRTAAALTGASVLTIAVYAGHLRGLGGGGVRFDGLEPWLLGVLALALAFLPCGGALSVDAWRGRADGTDRGGQLVIRALVSALFAGLVLGQLTGPFLSGVRIEQLLWARFGATPLPGVATLAAVLVIAIECLGVVAPWSPRMRRPVFAVLAGAVLLSYPLFYLGTFPAIVALLLFASLDPEESLPALERS